MHFYDNEENYEKSLHSLLFKVSAWGRELRELSGSSKVDCNSSGVKADGGGDG